MNGEALLEIRFILFSLSDRMYQVSSDMSGFSSIAWESGPYNRLNGLISSLRSLCYYVLSRSLKGLIWSLRSQSRLWLELGVVSFSDQVRSILYNLKIGR